MPRCRGQALRICRASGRFLSDIRADRSLPHKPQSSSEDDRRHFITSLRVGLYCLSPRYAVSVVIGRLTPRSPHCRTNKMRNVASLPLSAISNGGFVSDGIIAVGGLTSGATATAAAYCLDRRSPCFGVVPHRALSACIGRTRSRPHPSPTCHRHTLISVPSHLLPRRVRSDCLSPRRGGMAIFPAVSFLFAFSVFGERATAYFSCTKLGRQLDFPPAH